MWVRGRVVGSGVIVMLVASLAGCARSWFAEREPWRHDAEVACLNSGAVREGTAVSLLKPIDGPGICGADFPLRVSALGEPAVSGYFDEPLRPPGAVPGAPSRMAPPVTYQPSPAAPAYSPAPYAPPPPAPGRAPGEPLSIAPPGAAPPGAAPGYGYSEYPPEVYPQQRARERPPATSVPLGRQAAPALTIAPATVTPAATLACPLVSVLDRFFSDRVQPAALRWFGQPVVEIKQISAYSCRGMNGNSNARISEHAFGNALDIAAFTLADGHRITVRDGWHGSPEEQGFLHDVQSGACEMFMTVLAPGSNVYHYDHMHVDLMRRASGRGICEPTAVPGEVAAARAGGRWRAGAAPYTGSVARNRTPKTGEPFAYSDVDRPAAIGMPGQD